MMTAVRQHRSSRCGLLLQTLHTPWSVCLHVLGKPISLAKATKQTEMPFRRKIRVGSVNDVSDGDAHWRHLANTSELSLCGGETGDAS